MEAVGSMSQGHAAVVVAQGVVEVSIFRRTGSYDRAFSAVAVKKQWTWPGKGLGTPPIIDFALTRVNGSVSLCHPRRDTGGRRTKTRLDALGPAARDA